MNELRGWTMWARGLAAGALVAAASVALAQELPPPPVFPPPPEQTQAPPPVFPPPPEQTQAPAPVFPEPLPVFPAPPPQFADPSFQPVPTGGRQSLKKIFAGTLATVAQTTGTTLLVGLTQAITGGLTDWFSRKLKVQPGAQAVPQAPVFPPPETTFDAASLPPPPVFAGAQALPPPPQFFDAQTGTVTAPDPVFAAALAAPADSTAVFAGLAFEVHAVGPNGATTAVNPATHEFRSGDRFVVFYRPTLPGQMDVVNVNPAGQRTQIDRVDLAAGQLAQLGPYEFTALTGEDQLKLILTPCSTPALLAATRDIVNVAAAPISASSSFALAGCSPVTRSIRDVQTRDIRKVAVEGTTGFALDPVSATEFSSGEVTPREVTIVFRHR